jgi:WhiB family transcriptional regulator, redox-sensing transcriptional regulator
MAPDTTTDDPSAGATSPAADAWMTRAGCRDLSTEAFFSVDLDDVAAAKRHCLACPVRTECLDAAVARGEQYGVWGGHLFDAGRIVLQKRRRGRPPRHPRAGDHLPEVEVPEAYLRLVARTPAAAGAIA